MEIVKEREEKEKGREEKKRGRRPKNHVQEYKINKKRTKFMVALNEDKESLEMVFTLLCKANNKDVGREIKFKDLALFGLSKLTDKDIEKIQENSLSEMEKVQKALKEYNKKNGTNLDLGEFLVKKLNIN